MNPDGGPFVAPVNSGRDFMPLDSRQDCRYRRTAPRTSGEPHRRPACDRFGTRFGNPSAIALDAHAEPPLERNDRCAEAYTDCAAARKTRPRPHCCAPADRDAEESSRLATLPRPYSLRLRIGETSIWPIWRPGPASSSCRSWMASSRAATWSILRAETQTGKTLLALYLAQRFIAGGSLFGKYAITPVQTVWYLVLEDPARRMQERLLDVRQEFAREPRSQRRTRSPPILRVSLASR